MNIRTCPVCGTEFAVEKKKGRPPKFCVAHRPGKSKKESPKNV